MVETLAGIWLFLLTAAAGFLAGRYLGNKKRPEPKRGKSDVEPAFGWQELLNFLQYDGSGLPPTYQNTERVNDGGETKHHGTAGAERVYPRHRV